MWPNKLAQSLTAAGKKNRTYEKLKKSCAPYAAVPAAAGKVSYSAANKALGQVVGIQPW